MKLKKIGVYSIVTFGSTAVIIFTIITICDFMLKEAFFFNKIDVWMKAYIYLSLSILVTLIQMVITLSKIGKKDNICIKQQDSTDSLLLYIETAFENERWTEVVKIAKSLSEALWYTGKFELRIKIGEMLEVAAEKSNNVEIRAETLLDDLGWTRYRMKQGGEKEIKEGLKIAEEHQFNYLIAKGHRHLCHINAVPGKTEIAQQHYLKAIEYTQKISNERRRNEMLGNVEYARAKLLSIQGNFDEALKAIECSIAYYRKNDDKDREVKMYNFKGKILLSLSKIDEALSIFKEGQKMAMEISNNVHIVSNGIGIAKIYFEQGKKNLGIHELKITEKYLDRMSDPVLKEEFKNLLFKIEEN